MKTREGWGVPFRLLACVCLLASAGCATKHSAPSGDLHPYSPTRAVELVAYEWNHRDSESYLRYVTDDFQFVFSVSDSNGAPFRDNPWTRDEEMVAVTRMLARETTSPTLDTLAVSLAHPLIAMPDPRPGKHARWHKVVRANFDLLASLDQTRYDIRGAAAFYLVRGDSAIIPQELVQQGAAPDSTEWWIERWEDETLPVSPGTHANAGIPRTLGWLKSQFLPRR